MADDTGAPHEIPFLEATDPPSIHGITSDMAAQIAERLGFVGKSIVATSETRTSSSYGLLTTPDRVQNVVLPTDGHIEVAYHAQWSQSTAVAANAAIFIGATQLQLGNASGGGTNPNQEAVTGTGTSNGIDHWLTTYELGLISDVSAGAAHPAAPVTTGMVVGSGGSGRGGIVRVFAAAGTYDVSVQFKTTSGTLTVKNRKLWVRAIPF